jgi:hypothetical protein
MSRSKNRSPLQAILLAAFMGLVFWIGFTLAVTRFGL